MKLQHLRTHGGAELDIYDYGAHIVRWRSASGRDWLFLSQQARYQQGRSIRGGVPIIFPQFSGFGNGLRHGFARCVDWTCNSIDTGPSARAEFSLMHNDRTMEQWPHKFRADFSVTLSDHELNMALSITNLDKEPFVFCAALHTYFAISALNEARLGGLQGLDYWNNDGSDFQMRHTQQGNVLTFDGPIDRVYFGCTTPIILQDKKGRLRITTHGFTEAVVWNPGPEESARLEDMEDDEYARMLCVEGVKLENPIRLAPGDSWQASQALQEDAGA